MSLMSDASITWDVGPARWEAFLAEATNATFFHTPGWYAAQAARADYRPAAALLRYDDGAEALLPMAVSRRFRGLISLCEAGIEGGYGGFVSTTRLSDAHLRAAYRLLRARYPDLIVTGSPFSPCEAAIAGGEASTAFTQLLEVREPEAQLRGMASKRAARVRKAAKVGFALTVVAQPDEDAVPSFYPLYAAHASYWRYDRWVRDEAYFRALLRHAGAHLVLFLVQLDGQPAGFRLLARQGSRAVGLHLATTPQHEKLDVGPFMIAETLAWCAANGCATFDFLPSGPLEGVQAYKASFGAQPAPFLSTSHMGLLGRGLSTVRSWVAHGRQAVLSPASHS